MCLAASLTSILLPSSLPFATTAAISSSTSRDLEGPKEGFPSPFGAGGLIPLGRRMGVPDTTTDEARPWYPMGRWGQAEGRGGPGTLRRRPQFKVCCSLAPGDIGPEQGQAEASALHVRATHSQKSV
jgi:hypothetical protein